jgi:hypothetical protein
MLNISVITNTFAVIAGALIGLLLKKNISERFQDILFQSVGIVTALIGISMGLEANNFLVVLSSMALGGLIGEGIKIEDKIGKIANKIEKSKSETTFVKGFIAATVLFLVGPVTVIGCINAGVLGDNSLIYLKSLLDFISAIILASFYGKGVLFSAASIFLVQGLFVTLSSKLSFLMDSYYLNDFTSVGGAIVIALALRILKIKDIKAGNFLPALIVVILINFILKFFI